MNRDLESVPAAGSWRLPAHRRVIVDLMHYQKELPMVAHDRQINLTQLSHLRGQIPTRISWTMIFIKTFALVARRMPELRQTYLPGLFPRIYQHHCSIATLAISRHVNGIDQLFFARFVSPESKPLRQLQSRLRHFQTDPVEQLFGDHLRIQKLPWPVRRLVWGSRLYISGAKRVKRLGTFGLTTLAARNTTIQQPISPLPFLLTYGPLDGESRLTLTIAYDHRIVDGTFIASVLDRIEQELYGSIAEELRDALDTEIRQSA